MAKNFIKQIFVGIVSFIVSFILSQYLENSIIAMSDFPLKNIFLLIIPGPQDSVLEFVQFIVYWVVGIWLVFFRED